MLTRTAPQARRFIAFCLSLAFTACAWAQEDKCGEKPAERWFRAAASGRLEIMVELLYLGCIQDPGMVIAPGKDERTALMLASSASQLSVVQMLLLLSRPPTASTSVAKKDEAGESALTAASRAGDRAIVEALRQRYPGESWQAERERAGRVAAAAGHGTLAECIGNDDCGSTERHRRSYLADAWKLGVEDLAVDAFQPYRPIYVIGRGTSRVNRAPSSPTRGNVPFQDFQAEELKFQLSFKNELFGPTTLGNRWRLWFAYTQQSNWQLLNGPLSSPFRNTNYEPELILTYDNRDTDRPYPVETKRSTLSPELVNFGLVHQSNGRSNPESRSWHRLYVQGGWQLGERVSLLPRIWLAEGTDDNPDIGHYQRADMEVRYAANELGLFAFLVRHNLNFKQNRGFLQADWQPKWQPLGGMKLHVQLTSGYGESLLDYNYHQTTLGLGLSIWDW